MTTCTINNVNSCFVVSVKVTLLMDAAGVVMNNTVNVTPVSVCILCLVSALTGVPLATVHTGGISGAENGNNGCEPCLVSVNVPSTVVTVICI